MGNPTSRQLQTLQPLSTFEFCPSGTDHDESVNDHALLTPLTLQIIMAIMVTFCALQYRQHSVACRVRHHQINLSVNQITKFFEILDECIGISIPQESSYGCIYFIFWLDKCYSAVQGRSHSAFSRMIQINVFYYLSKLCECKLYLDFVHS